MKKFHARDYKAFYMTHVKVSGNHYSVVVNMLGSVVNGLHHHRGGDLVKN